MRRFCLFLLALLCLSGVSAVNTREFRINVWRMLPMTYPSREVSYGYFLQVRNDSVQLYLPYMGVAYQAPYGGGDGLDFKRPITDFVEKSGKKGRQRISFRTSNQGFRYDIFIEFLPSGPATIDVVPINAQRISYDGDTVDLEP